MTDFIVNNMKIGVFNDIGCSFVTYKISKILDCYFDTNIINYFVGKFKDGEKKLINDVKKYDFIVIVQSINPDFTELEILLLKVQNALFLSKNIILVIPYLSYFRQDVKPLLGEKIIELILSYKEIIVVFIFDPHYFDLKDDRIHKISTYDLFYLKIKELQFCSDNTLIILPDKSGLKRNKIIINKLNFKTIFSCKLRSESGEVVSSKLDEYPFFENIIILDDMIDTGQTILKTLDDYIKNIKIHDKSPKVYIFCTHGVFSELNMDLINDKIIKKIYISNTIYKVQNQKVEYIDVSEVLVNKILKIIKKSTSINYSL